MKRILRARQVKYRRQESNTPPVVRHYIPIFFVPLRKFKTLILSHGSIYSHT